MLGSTYALVAIGYSLIFGVLRLLHLAHGEVFMVGAFAGLLVVLWLSLGPFAAVFGGLVVAGILGVILELVAFRPIRRRGDNYLAPIRRYGLRPGCHLHHVYADLHHRDRVCVHDRAAPVRHTLAARRRHPCHL